MQHPSNPTASNQEPSKGTAHPGVIRIEYAWNHSVQMLDATNLPDTRRFIFFDSPGAAKYRVPVEREEVITLDAGGKSVEPKQAAFVSVMQYGPSNRFLREIQAAGAQ